MAKIEKDYLDHNATLTAMINEIERIKNLETPRQYLGFSVIGEECQRKLWYDFRLVSPKLIPGNVHLKFEDGFTQEDIAADRLRLLPQIKLLTRDSNGQQFGYRLLNGHFSGHCDGHILGIIEAPKTWHIWEHKSSEKMSELNEAVRTYGTKDALQNWNYTYYCQAVLYMKMQGFGRHFLTCSTPGGREYTSCRTEANSQLAKNLIDKAESIITAEKPLAKLSERPEFYKCKWCNNKDVCHNEQIPQVNCRTCAFSEPEMKDNNNDGKWFCHRLNSHIDFDQQLKGCDNHLYLNTLLPYDAIDCDQTREIPNWIKYKSGKFEFYNVNKLSIDSVIGKKYTSKELYSLKEFSKLQSMEETIIQEFNGSKPIMPVKSWDKHREIVDLKDII